MALSRSLFTGDVAAEVLMPEPLACIFRIIPLRPLMKADHADRQGLKLEGFAQGEGGRQTIQASFQARRQLEANLWLAKQLVIGWDGLKDDDGEIIPFSAKALDVVASQPDCWQLIYSEAEKLAGRRIEEERGN